MYKHQLVPLCLQGCVNLSDINIATIVLRHSKFYHQIIDDRKVLDTPQTLCLCCSHSMFGWKLWLVACLQIVADLCCIWLTSLQACCSGTKMHLCWLLHFWAPGPMKQLYLSVPEWKAYYFLFPVHSDRSKHSGVLTLAFTYLLSANCI